MNDADSGTAARVWRSPLSSTTPSTGIPARRPRRRRARSCLSLTPFSRDPRDRSTLRTLPGRESTYEHTLVASWYPIPPLQIMIRLPPPLFFCVLKLLLLFVFAANERRPHRNAPCKRCLETYSLSSIEYVKGWIASVKEKSTPRDTTLLALIEPRRCIAWNFFPPRICKNVGFFFSKLATCFRDIFYDDVRMRISEHDFPSQFYHRTQVPFVHRSEARCLHIRQWNQICFAIEFNVLQSKTEIFPKVKLLSSAHLVLRNV